MSAPSALREVRAENASPMTLDGTRTFVLGGDRPVVIDPGPADAAHLRSVLTALGGSAPLAILLTHGHPDHAGGAELLAQWTGAPVWMGAGALRLPFAQSRVGRWLRDGDEIRSDAGPVVVVETPGHAPEHLCFWWRGDAAGKGGALFVGDLFMGGGDTTLVAPPEGDLRAYLRSLERVESLSPGVLHPAHGPSFHDVPQTVERYRRHRRERIEQVRRASRARPEASAAELVAEVYGPELSTALRGAAEGSVQAILAYLRSGPTD